MEMQLRRDKKHMISEKMIKMYCKYNHSKSTELCYDCIDLMEYSKFRTSKCPYIGITLFCVNCPTPCYKVDYKEVMRKVMKYSGPRFLFKHPIYTISHVISDYRGRGASK